MKFKINNKKGFEFSFGWLFAILVGAAILFMAIYGAMKIIDLGKYNQQTFAGKEFGIILNPVEAGLSASTVVPIAFPVRTRVFNDCDAIGPFGRQLISTSIQSGLGKEWGKPSIKSTFYNKYIFSSSTVEGKNMYAFSKSFNFPYQVADIIYIYSSDDRFCFVNPPDSIKGDLDNLNGTNFNVTDSSSKCPKLSKKVCFGTTGCDVSVNLLGQVVKKYGQNLYYIDDTENTLLLGAIFSDPAIYECQVKRLMKRTSQLASIYRTKSESLSSKGCSSGMESDLISFGNKTFSINNSIDMRDIYMYEQNLGDKNSALACKLY